MPVPVGGDKEPHFFLTIPLLQSFIALAFTGTEGVFNQGLSRLRIPALLHDGHEEPTVVICCLFYAADSNR